LNTPQALAYLSDVSTQLQAVLIEEDMVDHFETMLQGIDDLLGLNLMAEEDISDAQKKLLAERSEAREAKDWTRADKARDRLLEQGIAVRDTPHGVIWSRL
jgi:cysteinyl-tRNA synthetase